MSLRLSSPTILALAALATAGIATPAAAQSSPFHPNSEKYSDAGAKPATGRSGSASLEGRALLAKDGTTLLEVTTGSLENGTTRGALRKVQFKVFDANDALQFTDNVNGLSAGYWSTEFQGLARNQRIQLQGNVDGIDGSRTDVVTIAASVKRRPDITVSAVTVPARAFVGAKVNVAATISELNGDVGARATCVLSIDGTSVLDQATGIWVDAGHTVSCAFQTMFTVVGVHQVQVYVTGVSPADWDTSNNSASASIQIISPETLLSYSGQFNSSDYDYLNHTKSSSADGSYVTEQTENGTRRNRALSLSAWTASDVFSFPTTVHSSMTTAAASAFDVTNSVPLQAGASWSGADCGSVYQGGYSVNVCNYHSGSYVRSEVDISSYDGRVTYFGNTYRAVGWVGYATNYSADNVSGFGAYPVGSSAAVSVELTDARGMKFVARPTIALQSSPLSSQWSSCSLNRRTTVTTCSDGYQKGTNTTGSVSGQ
jgi:hypothetical protein